MWLGHDEFEEALRTRPTESLMASVASNGDLRHHMAHLVQRFSTKHSVDMECLQVTLRRAGCVDPWAPSGLLSDAPSPPTVNLLALDTPTLQSVYLFLPEVHETTRSLKAMA